jgi:hypothetical protein
MEPIAPTFEEIKEILAKVAISQKETWDLVKENQKMIGYLGNKFGSFAEAMALPSMQRILEEDFGMTHTQPRYRIKKDGKIVQEIDMIAHANGSVNTAVVVEIKSDLKGKDVYQVIGIMDKFFELFPEHKGKKLYGIIAYIDASEEGKSKALKKGFYLASIHDELFELKTPVGFIPKDFSK